MKLRSAIAGLGLALAAALPSHASIARLDLYGIGNYQSSEGVPFHAFIAIDRVRETQLDPNGGMFDGYYGATNFAAYGVEVLGMSCGADFPARNIARLSVSSTGASGSAITLFQDHCSVGFSTTFGPNAPARFNGMALAGSTLQYNGFIRDAILDGTALTGWVYRVDGVVVSASDPYLVPEPATLGMLSLGFMGVMALRRRQTAR